MDFLKILITFILAFNAYSFELKEIKLDCLGSSCGKIEESLKRMEKREFTNESLYRYLSYELNKPIYRKFYFEYSKGVLYVQTESREKVQSIEVFGEDEIITKRVLEDLPVKANDYFDENTFEIAIEDIQALYFKNNYDAVQVDILRGKGGVNIVINLNSFGVKKLETIKVDVKNDEVRKISAPYWEELRNQTWDRTVFQRKLDEYVVLLKKMGFWKASVKQTLNNESDKAISALLKVDLGARYGFAFSGAKLYGHSTFLNEIRKSFRGNRDELKTETILQIINDLYKSKGFFFTEIAVRDYKKVDKLGKYNFYYITIKEGKRVALEDIIFSGNGRITDKIIRVLFEKKSSVLLKRGFLDLKGIQEFKNILKEYYISNGFVFSNVEEPVTAFSDDGNKAFVTYKISENSHYNVGKIVVSGIPDKGLEKEIKEILHNKEGKSFNVIKMDEDLKNVINLVKSKGYYFASYKEKNPKKMVQVSNATKLINLNLSFDVGKKSYLGDLIVTGNKETKAIVIRREIWLKKGELITPQKINNFITRLRTLGLFSSVNITPFIGDAKSKDEVFLNFIIKVRETTFGRGEFAPGFRTDLGYKASVKTSYNNFMGMNRSIIAKVQANLRNSYKFLDERREREEKDLLEGIVQVQYVEPYLFHKLLGLKEPLEARVGFKFQRRRYSGFDADIMSVTPRITKNFSKRSSASLKYELDDIRQFDATEEEDADRFKIGSITPSFTYDGRDNVNDPRKPPRKGFWLNFSWEFANPYFLSQDDPELTINYNKAVLRNFFYYPIGNFVMASSLTLGMQTNFSTEKLKDAAGNTIIDADTGEEETIGYIPSLKVFRLSGIDTLRGFSEDESNLYIDGSDITVIRDKAYLLNFKLEPRYYVNDSIATSLFFDAGRVFKNHFTPLKLRTSAGISFKFLTPVGSLDLNYGVKLKRDRFDSGGREKFGRAHITIGQF